MHSFAFYELHILRWGEARGIVKNGKPLGQAIKTLEETKELIDALHQGNDDAAMDAIGDILVTLIMVCATKDFNILDCIRQAYEEIKDRKGYLRPDGVFVKETPVVDREKESSYSVETSKKLHSLELLVTELEKQNEDLVHTIKDLQSKWTNHFNLLRRDRDYFMGRSAELASLMGNSGNPVDLLDGAETTKSQHPHQDGHHLG